MSKSSPQNLFGAQSKLTFSGGEVDYFRLGRLEEMNLAEMDKLPFSIKVLLESCLRNCDNFEVSEQDVKSLAGWKATPAAVEVPFKPRG